jgi:hypothetical protein
MRMPRIPIEPPYDNVEGSDVDLARTVAADSDWTEESTTGELFDADDEVVASSIDDAARKMRVAGWFVPGEPRVPGVNWHALPPKNDRSRVLRAS